MKVFVYGSLMTDRWNHGFMNGAEYIGEGILEGYALYHLITYPAIKKMINEAVKGEVYEISEAMLPALDELEDEGQEYKRTNVKVRVKDEVIEAQTYVYMLDVEPLRQIPFNKQPWNPNYVWYVCYGSNLLEEMFMYYLLGGRSVFDGTEYRGCSDQTMYLTSCSCTIPYRLYFSRSSAKWGNGGVAFLDVCKKGMTLGRMYLVTREQYEEIKAQEGLWYQQKLELGTYQGLEMLTFTDTQRMADQVPHESYLNVIRHGLRETYPEMIDEEIDKYLENAIKCDKS